MKRLISDLLARIRGQVSTEKLLQTGMSVGKNFRRMNDVWIDPGHCWLIHIGDNVTLAPRVTVLAHDAALQNALHITKVGNVQIGNNVFVGAGSILLPGTTIGDNTIIGAGSVIRNGIPANSVAVGNPAKVIMSLSEYIGRTQEQLETMPIFGSEYLLPSIDDKKKEEMYSILKKSKGFLR